MQSAPRTFWQEALAIQGSATPKVLPDVLIFGLLGLAVSVGSSMIERLFQVRIGLEVAPFEIVGAALGLLLILRTNAGYDRWWEARKIWGGIVNQSRNLAISGLAYGPSSDAWRQEFIRWVAAFPHIVRASLRQEPLPSEVSALLSESDAGELRQAGHRPSTAAWRIGLLLRQACDLYEMDRFAFIQIDRERAQLMDHVGACERILKTPLPTVYSIKIRRFILLFLVTVPFVLVHRIQGDWLIALITMLVAYPLLSLDCIGSELQNPFAEQNLSHLPLTEISATIERNVLTLHTEVQAAAANDSTVATAMDGNGNHVSLSALNTPVKAFPATEVQGDACRAG